MQGQFMLGILNSEKETSIPPSEATLRKAKSQVLLSTYFDVAASAARDELLSPSPRYINPSTDLSHTLPGIRTWRGYSPRTKYLLGSFKSLSEDEPIDIEELFGREGTG
jgi:hypothetical protein